MRCVLLIFYFWAIFVNFPIAKTIAKIYKTRLSVTIFFLSLRKFRTRRRHVPTKEKRISTPILIARFRKIFTIFVNIKHPSSNTQQIMKTIQIKANDFFELIKLKDTSMWEIFAQMIDGEEKEIIFLDEEEKVLFSYILPKNLEKLEEDRKTFAKEYAEKMSNLN